MGSMGEALGRYRLPASLRGRSDTQFIGQKQKWYLLRLLADDSAICTNQSLEPEFDGWRWVATGIR